MAFGEPAPVGPQNHREVRVLGRLDTQSSHNVQLPGCVVEMIITAHHVSDLHLAVVDNNREIVGRHTIRAHDDQIVQLRIVENYLTTDSVAHANLPAGGRPETNDRIHIGPGLGTISTATVITRFSTTGFLLLPHSRKLFSSAIAVIRVTRLQQLLSKLLIVF